LELFNSACFGAQIPSFLENSSLRLKVR